jgi:hypothetical protein
VLISRARNRLHRVDNACAGVAWNVAAVTGARELADFPVVAGPWAVADYARRADRLAPSPVTTALPAWLHRQSMRTAAQNTREFPRHDGEGYGARALTIPKRRQGRGGGRSPVSKTVDAFGGLDVLDCCVGVYGAYDGSTWISGESYRTDIAPMRQRVELSEIAEVAAFVVSNAANQMHGASVDVNGGYTCTR